MKEQIITYETAKLAKEKGFIFHTLANYECDEDGTVKEIQWKFKNLGDFLDNLHIPVCTQSLLQKWLREVHNIEVLVYCNASGWMWELNKAMNLNSFAGGTHISWSEETGPNDSGEWDTYELALEAGIQEALKLI